MEYIAAKIHVNKWKISEKLNFSLSKKYLLLLEQKLLQRHIICLQKKNLDSFVNWEHGKDQMKAEA